MRVTRNREVDAAIRTLSEEDRRKVLAWFDHLGNWENDEEVRKLSKRMIFPDTYVLNTSDDVRIFFTLDSHGKEIAILDVAKPSRFAAVGVKPE